jgi:hypothetical protein
VKGAPARRREWSSLTVQARIEPACVAITTAGIRWGASGGVSISPGTPGDATSLHHSECRSCAVIWTQRFATSAADSAALAVDAAGDVYLAGSEEVAGRVRGYVTRLAKHDGAKTGKSCSVSERALLGSKAKLAAHRRRLTASRAGLRAPVSAASATSCKWRSRWWPCSGRIRYCCVSTRHCTRFGDRNEFIR